MALKTEKQKTGFVYLTPKLQNRKVCFLCCCSGRQSLGLLAGQHKKELLSTGLHLYPKTKNKRGESQAVIRVCCVQGRLGVTTLMRESIEKYKRRKKQYENEKDAQFITEE